MLLQRLMQGPHFREIVYIRTVCLLFRLCLASHGCCQAEIHLERNSLWEFETQTLQMAHPDSV